MKRFYPAALLLLLLAGAGAAGGAERRNVLFIAVDDLRPLLGAYGDRLARTPNMDRLAAQGVLFERAYCQFPLCNPSRSSMLTGLYPPQTGVQDNLSYFRTTRPETVTLPEYFRARGYHTARTGKIFHGGIDDARGWVEGGEQGGPRPVRGDRQRRNYAKSSDRWEAVKGEGEQLADYRTATAAIRLLERNAERPFFIAAGFLKPHTPLVAPERFFRLYDAHTMPLPPDFGPRARPAEGAPEASLGPNGDLFIQRDAGPEEARQMIRAYYACVSFIDAQVGRLLDAVERLGLSDNTVIVLWGDHGFHLGEKGKWSKHASLYEPALRVPVIFKSPGCAAGKKSPRPVGLIDIYPTLTELAQLPAPPGLAGQSLAPLLVDPGRTWPRPALSYARTPLGAGRTIRTERYRLTEWNEGKGGFELYDYEKDSDELKNLAADADRAPLVRELKALLQRTAPAP